MLDRSGLKKYSNPSWFKQNLMAGSRVTSISWLGCGEHHGITLNRAKRESLKPKKASMISHTADCFNKN